MPDTQPTDEQVDRAAFANAVWNALKADANDLRRQKRILSAFDATIAEAEAREARLIEQIRLDRDTFRDCDIIDDPIGAAAQLEAAMHNCNAILQENPDG